jgi:prepilin-type N-terminal cleavage/methylation domain-containing protein
MIGVKQKQNTKRYNKSGMTLIELLISVALLSTVIITVTEIFKISIDGQRKIVAAQNVQESLKYFFEVVSKEMRMAKVSEAGECGNTSGQSKVYFVSLDSQELYFKNYNDQCVVYSLATVDDINRFQIERGLDSGYITPESVNLTSIRFYVVDDLLASTQSRVSLHIDAEAVGEYLFHSLINLQTSITSRYYY